LLLPLHPEPQHMAAEGAVTNTFGWTI